MSHNSLREISKFLSGLVAADLITVVWLSQQNLLPIHFLGLSFSQEMVVPTVVFDLALLLLLIHYGWHIGKIPKPREHTYILVAGIIFTAVAVLHLWRLFSGAPLIVGEWEMPLWLSWFGVAVAGYMGYASFRFAMRIKG